MLTIATWNIGLARLSVLGVPLVDAVPHRAIRTAPIVEALAARREAVDIWLLQEAYGNDIRGRLSRIDGYRAVFGPGGMRDCGLCILIRDDWKSDKTRHGAFPANDWIEVVVAAKGVLACDVETALGPMRIGTLHASYDGRGRASIKRKAPHTRRKQVGIALDLMEQGPEMPMLLGGDFNASEAYEPRTHEAITGRGWRDLAMHAAEKLGPDLNTWSKSNALVSDGLDEPDHDIDLICGRRLPRGWRATAEVFMHEEVVPLPDGSLIPLSDHHGLKITLTG
ncbi:MAG: endonuclease/exonuclease/phosphatase family protein [Minwuia sp.]|uniref:endonuclease/exonuclease/phosphatase family protein n=1 Tax=Minwuia sp. TaxID=2493630 RepID=UPI003A89C906